MNPIEYNSVKNQPSMFMTDLATSNYFNSKLNVIRVINPVNQDQLLDFKLAPSWYPPNPSLHKVLLITSTENISNIGLTSDRLQLSPGIEEEGATAEIPMGIAHLIDKNQRLYTIDNQTGSTGFSIKNTNMFESDNVKLALSPPTNKYYTNNDNNESNEIGIYMNNDTVVIRSRGAQLTLGDEGIHIGGKQFWESTTHSKEIMQDNFIHQLIPSTIPTAGVSIPQLPNFGMIAQIADTANKVSSIIKKTKKISQSVNNLV